MPRLKVGDLVKIRYDHLVRVKNKDGKYIYGIPVAGIITSIKGKKAWVYWTETNCPEINAISMKIIREHDEYFLESLVLYAPYLKRICSESYLSALQEK